MPIASINLPKKFGDTIDEVYNPYAEVDGGAVEWAIYQYGDVSIRLSSASERSYRELSLKKSLTEVQNIYYQICRQPFRQHSKVYPPRLRRI